MMKISLLEGMWSVTTHIDHGSLVELCPWVAMHDVL